jgi:hypothetical protein
MSIVISPLQHRWSKIGIFDTSLARIISVRLYISAKVAWKRRSWMYWTLKLIRAVSGNDHFLIWYYDDVTRSTQTDPRTRHTHPSTLQSTCNDTSRISWLSPLDTPSFRRKGNTRFAVVLTKQNGILLWLSVSIRPYITNSLTISRWRRGYSCSHQRAILSSSIIMRLMVLCESMLWWTTMIVGTT